MAEVLKVSQEKIDRIEKFRDKFFFKTGLNFLFAHNGYRPGRIHLFQGASGGGKSTLFKTLLLDFLSHNPDRIASIWLSEEQQDDFIAETTKHPQLKKKLSEGCLRLFSEVEGKRYSNQELEANLLEMFSSAEILFFDNITTSSFYLDKSTSEQGKVIQTLKALVKKHKIPMVVFAHTGADNSIRLTDQNDIRGSKSFVNFCEHIYMVLNFELDNEKITTLRDVKSRSYPTKAFGYFLKFDPETMTYSKSWEKDAATFQKVLKLSKKVMGAK